jgi:hypothetical protein
MTTKQDPREIDSISIITHACQSGQSMEDYLKSVAKKCRVKVKNVSRDLKDFEEDSP